MILIYAGLWIISFAWIQTMEEEIKEKLGILYSPALYTVINVVISLFLFGLIDLIRWCCVWIAWWVKRINLMIYGNLLLWSIKRKNKIK